MALIVEQERKSPAAAEGASSSHSRTLVEQFRAAVSRATKFLANLVQEGSPSLHPEFREVDGWNWNKLGLQTSGMATPKLKVRFFFDAAEVSLLNGAQIPVKFARNLEETVKADYCGFAYPLRDEHFGEVERWATRFRHAAVFTYGGEKNGQWVPGEFKREIARAGP